MSTDDGITDEEQYAAARRDLARFPHGLDSITAWLSGAAWARDHLSTQEPSMTTNEQYAPDETSMEAAWIEHEASHDDLTEAAAEFHRFLAQVHRDAAREALARLAEHSDSRDGDGVKDRLGGIIRIWRDAHYPEEDE